MKSYRQWMVVSMLLALTATGAVVSAQDKQADKAAKAQQKAERNVIVQRGGDFIYSQDGAPPSHVWFGDPGTSFFVSSEMLTLDSAVKGQPYSAQAVTESIQTLADGNRIVRRTTANVYRDGEGRTRRDQTVGDMAPYATAVGEPSQVTLIYDPVAGAHYTLDARSKTARKMNFTLTKEMLPDGTESVRVAGNPAFVAGFKAGMKESTRPDEKALAEAEAAKVHVEVHAAGEPMPLEAKKWNLAAGGVNTFNLKVRDPKIEQLGKQTIEGIEAEGRRATITIPAGEVGNEQPINIIDETWYSPELKVTVMTRHSDPRMGETVYKLTNLNRAEPAHSLFEVPSDYTIKETVEPKMKMLLEREMQRSRKPADKQEN